MPNPPRKTPDHSLLYCIFVFFFFFDFEFDYGSLSLPVHPVDWPTTAWQLLKRVGGCMWFFFLHLQYISYMNTPIYMGSVYWANKFVKKKLDKKKILNFSFWKNFLNAYFGENITDFEFFKVTIRFYIYCKYRKVTHITLYNVKCIISSAKQLWAR